MTEFLQCQFTAQNTLQEKKNKMRKHRNNNATLNLISETGVYTLEIGNAFYVYLLDAPFCNVLDMMSHRFCRLV
jgi:ribosome biogenesis protein Nip4